MIVWAWISAPALAEQRVAAGLVGVVVRVEQRAHLRAAEALAARRAPASAEPLSTSSTPSSLDSATTLPGAPVMTLTRSVSFSIGQRSRACR